MLITYHVFTSKLDFIHLQIRRKDLKKFLLYNLPNHWFRYELSSELRLTECGVRKMPYVYWYPIRYPKKVYGEESLRYVYVYYTTYIYTDSFKYFINVMVDNNIEEWISECLGGCFRDRSFDFLTYGRMYSFKNIPHETKTEEAVTPIPSVYVYYKQEIPTLAKAICNKEIKGLISTIYDRNVLGLIDEFI